MGKRIEASGRALLEETKKLLADGSNPKRLVDLSGELRVMSERLRRFNNESMVFNTDDLSQSLMDAAMQIENWNRMLADEVDGKLNSAQRRLMEMSLNRGGSRSLLTPDLINAKQRSIREQIAKRGQDIADPELAKAFVKIEQAKTLEEFETAMRESASVVTIPTAIEQDSGWVIAIANLRQEVNTVGEMCKLIEDRDWGQFWQVISMTRGLTNPNLATQEIIRHQPGPGELWPSHRRIKAVRDRLFEVRDGLVRKAVLSMSEFKLTPANDQ